MTTPPTDRAAVPAETVPCRAATGTIARCIVLPAAVAVTVVLGACQADSTATNPATPATVSASSPAAPTTPAPTSPTPVPTRTATPGPSISPSGTPPKSTPSADVTIDVVIADGKVRPNAENLRVKEGQTVTVTITSDVDESIHVHGYDQTAEATPDKPGAVTFTADVKGVFEIETHESAKLVAKLIVS